MKKIFLSYCWQNDNIADLICSLFEKEGIKIIRDKHDLNYKQSITEFMGQVRDADYVIMLISKEYLKSINCMYEVLEFIKDKDYKMRILPLIHQDTNIFNIIGRIDYIKYWEEEYANTKKAAERLSREASVEISNEIKKIVNIKNTISEFISNIIDMNNVVYKNEIDIEEFMKIMEVVNENTPRRIEDKISDELISKEEKGSIEEIYMGYIGKWCDFVDINNWNVWTSWMLANGQPKITVEMLKKLEELREWLFSRVWLNKFVELENSFENFRLVLNDLYDIFSEHCIVRGGMYSIEKFYKIDRWDEDLYSKLLNEYNFHVDLVQDLTLELTRAANYICDNVRKSIKPDFRLEEGKLLATYGPCRDFSFKTICPEYKGEQRILQPYPGIEKFKLIRTDRDYGFGIGISSTDPGFLRR